LDQVAFIICCSKPEVLDPEAVELTASMTNSSDNPIQQAKFVSFTVYFSRLVFEKKPYLFTTLSLLFVFIK
jgi:hypothetical protein